MSTSVKKVERALAEISAGKMVILVDDEDRENEGDLILAADRVTPEAINFMAKHARGLICLALTDDRVSKLGLPMMVEDNQTERHTAFTISIEARVGVTTGISAADRAQTVRVAVDPEAGASDIVSPGHVFPLRARPGGVLQRTGHTEGSVDLARLAGRNASAVICEIMKDDGTMARLPDLQRFAEEHGLSLLSIADLVEYRLRTERLIECRETVDIELPSGGDWTAHAFRVTLDGRQFLALTHGEIDASPTLVRVHKGSVLGDVFGVRAPNRMILDDAARAIEAEGRGVILFIPGQIDLEADLRRFAGLGRPARKSVLREFGIGAQVLAELGLKKLRLLTHQPRRIAAVDGYGLEVVEQVAMDGSGASTAAH